MATLFPLDVEIPQGKHHVESTPIAIPNATSRDHLASVRFRPPKRMSSASMSSSPVSLKHTLSLKKSISINSIKSSVSKHSPASSCSSLDDEVNYKLVRHKVTAHPLSANDVPVYDGFFHDPGHFDATDAASFDSASSIESSTSVKSSLPFLVPKKSVSNSFVSHITSSANSIPPPCIRRKSSELLIKALGEKQPGHAKRLASSPLASPPRKSLVSNLTNSFKSLKNSVNNTILTYSLSWTPRMTDDVLPKTKVGELTELQTWSARNISIKDDSKDLIRLTSSKNFRNRDERINSNFLRLYAQDYTSRMEKLLPNSYTNEEFHELFNQSDSVKKFHEKYNFYKISNMSRDKLWNNVILPPRKDNCPMSTIDPDDYIYVGHNDSVKSSLIRLNGDYLPWSPNIQSNGKCSLKPAGCLHGVKGYNNGQSPSAGVSKPQFTIKGWCNKRWVDSSEV